MIAERGGFIFPQITDVFPGQEVIDRTFINTWEDPVVVDAVKATGRKQLVIAGLWTEICVALTEVLQQHAAGSGIAYLWEQQLLNTPVPAIEG
ncbi:MULTISPECIES: isochorismatase family protein [Pseudomonas]|uniref:isochorismatase family protein n=1 Tax=Pseudomonas TaxID=286 RepID=UPI000812AE75|nr:MULTISPECIES: isochorismatase family protein [Pseudomonas]CRM02305.1 Isochorismatase family protein [Pseudomonas sp. 24 R 17]CRM13741.1 Isochorismatase family protein [Pseudomonas sp. 58 R 12]CRM22276.1 Isochorismatase family protein [Pseudomonas sp. 52 E 6]CRM75169.1 Isochorismatase family protein [Pseudomonas sp. 35 E 8]